MNQINHYEKLESELEKSIKRTNEVEVEEREEESLSNNEGNLW